MATEIRPALTDNGKIQNGVDTQQTITLSRRIVYFQAALLGVIATTFFVFGMMVGSLTSKNELDAKIVDCEISGRVFYTSDGRQLSDSGAVVMILPIGKAPERRLNPRSIHPDSFDPTDNEVIETVVELGGAIVRTDGTGKFNVEVNSPAKYSVIVVSKNSNDRGGLEKKQMAALSTYFMPVEEVRDGKSIYVTSIRVDSTQKKLGDISL